MSKPNGWIPLDKNLSQYLPYNRSYTRLEAMFSYTKDMDENKKITISGYSKLWQWSRNKVRNFIEKIGTPKGQERDRERTGKGHPIHYIDKALWERKDREGTGRGQGEDTTPNPNPNPNPKKKDIRDGFADKSLFHFKQGIFKTEAEILELGESEYHPLIIEMLNKVRNDYSILNELPEPITHVELHDLLTEEKGSRNILDKFSEMANYSGIKKKISANLTVRNWIRKDEKKGKK